MEPMAGERATPSMVIVVDDDEATRRLVARWVTSTELGVIEAGDGDEGLRSIRTNPDEVAVVILDVMLPGRDGYEILSQLRADPTTEAIPVILLTAHANDEPDVVRSIESGASEHIAKPFSGPVLVAKVKKLAGERRKSLDVGRRLQRAEAGSLRDPLTGLFNRRQYDAMLAIELAYAKRHHTPFALAIVDLDHFKSVNDGFGHQGGDLVLCHFADLLRKNLRTEDHAFRVGGEEFALLLRGTDEYGAAHTLTRLRELLGAVPVAIGEQSCTVRFSAGVVTADGLVSADELMRKADQALYVAKRSGRDRTVLVGG
jgi:diguanylate cyclase (GGDEF)-like protein